MCPVCKKYNNIGIERPYELFDIIDSLKKEIEENNLAIASDQLDLIDQITRDKPWPEDYIELEFECKNCSARYKLSCNTYHGSGGKIIQTN